jgi:ketosteroid isomerase-like protein
MSNVETVQAIYAAFGRGDVPFILDQVADDVAWEAWADSSAQTAGLAHLAPRHGKAGVAEFFSVISGFEVIDFDVIAILDGGDKFADYATTPTPRSTSPPPASERPQLG